MANILFEHFRCSSFGLVCIRLCVRNVWLKCDNLLCNSLPKLSLISDHFFDAIFCYCCCRCDVLQLCHLCFSVKNCRNKFKNSIRVEMISKPHKKQHSFFTFVYDGKFIIRFCFSFFVSNHRSFLFFFLERIGLRVKPKRKLSTLLCTHRNQRLVL